MSDANRLQLPEIEQVAADLSHEASSAAPLNQAQAANVVSGDQVAYGQERSSRHSESFPITDRRAGDALLARSF